MSDYPDAHVIEYAIRLVEALRPEQPDLRRSKVCYLFEEGMLPAVRESDGTFRVGNEDVTLLRRVLELQAAPNYLPLSRIREILALG